MALKLDPDVEVLGVVAEPGEHSSLNPLPRERSEDDGVRAGQLERFFQDEEACDWGAVVDQSCVRRMMMLM